MCHAIATTKRWANMTMKVNNAFLITLLTYGSDIERSVTACDLAARARMLGVSSDMLLPPASFARWQCVVLNLLTSWCRCISSTTTLRPVLIPCRRNLMCSAVAIWTASRAWPTLGGAKGALSRAYAGCRRKSTTSAAYLNNARWPSQTTFGTSTTTAMASIPILSLPPHGVLPMASRHIQTTIFLAWRG